ncbi:carboxymuconolactone decarboxylase family protein [Plantactinospora sp. BC1]|uniref:carboxymuconolactone decarboxylase family protein n=1 Tax=Plantactinospora sp. BC1 TaxID=2108470 RepID=UPI001F39B56B|nr:hypothetical protein [Plantactinospora sp. BC1]
MKKASTISRWHGRSASGVAGAALALAESATRLADRADAVPDEIWADAAKHFDERELAALVLWIATTNFFNRINVTTRQPAPQNWG